MFRIQSCLGPLLLLLLPLGLWGGAVDAVEAPLLARSGEIDISSWDFATQGELVLRGDWHFYWQRHFKPEEIRELVFNREVFHSIQAPGGQWKNIAPGIDIHGIASYVLHIKGISTKQRELSVLSDAYMGVHETWLYWPKTDTLQLLGKSGRMTVDPQASIVQYKRQLTELQQVDADEAWLVINHYEYILPGSFGFVPRINQTKIMHEQRRVHEWGAFLLLGMFSLLALTNFSLFLLRREDKASLAMSLVVCVMLLRYFMTENIIFEIYPEPNALLSKVCAYFIMFYAPFGMAIYAEFLRRSFPGFINRKAVSIAWILSFSGVTLTVISFSASMKWGPIIMILLFPTHLWVMSGLVPAYRAGNRAALFALAGLGVFIFGVLYDFLVYISILKSDYIGHFGMLVFTFMQSLVVGYNFAAAFRTAERLSVNLQNEVEIQTHKLRLQRDKLEEQKVELEFAHVGLREADEQKTRFFRSISHELRTPLTLILGSVQSANRPEEVPRSLDVIGRNAARLYRLVNQLLDFQKLALSQTRLRLDELDILRFIQGMEPYFIAACQDKSIDFKLVIAAIPKDRWRIMAQADALEKIVFNYLANALKFTPKGGSIRLELSWNRGKIRITVVDSGPGIPEKEQEKLFKLFSQIEGPHQESQQGTGLGLALVKELVQHMQGESGVLSVAGQGASFWAEFPALTQQDKLEVLVIDRDADDLQDLLTQLRDDAGIASLKASQDPIEAMQIIGSHRVSVLICASNMGVDLDALLKLAAAQKPACWKVLIGTSDRQRSDLRSLQTETIDAWIERPLGAEFFRSLRDKLLPVIQDRPILDLVYLEDDRVMQEEFSQAIASFTLLENFKVISHGSDLRLLLQNYRIRAVVTDVRLEGEQGTDLLAMVAKVSPDTFRILLTGENSQDILAAGIQNAQAHYIIYKPADLEQEVKVIESYVGRSAIQHRAAPVEQQTSNRDWQLAGLDRITELDNRLGKMTDKPADARATILVVDDIGDMRALVAGFLQAHQYHVLHAADGQQALQLVLVERTKIDLIITDWIMPVMTGPELITRLHAQEELASLPTILLTAKTDAESKSYGTKIGASAYLGKPFDEMELISTVENLLDLKKRERKIDELNRFINTNVLQRFLPPDLVADLVAGRAKFDDAAQLRVVTVLFADLCGFTQSTERLGPERIAKILNSFLVKMTDVIFSVGGTIDKFMGDGILVMFGAPRAMEPEAQIQCAARCALLMQEALHLLNVEWGSLEEVSFAMRIGIHHGPAIVGSFGGERRSDYTAVGNTVNIASRVESCALPGEILVTPVMVQYLPSAQCESAGAFKLKGIEGEMVLYRLLAEVQHKRGAA